MSPRRPANSCEKQVRKHVHSSSGFQGKKTIAMDVPRGPAGRQSHRFPEKGGGLFRACGFPTVSVRLRSVGYPRLARRHPGHLLWTTRNPGSRGNSARVNSVQKFLRRSQETANISKDTKKKKKRKKKGPLIKLAQKYDHQANTYNGKQVSAKIQTQYLSKQEMNADRRSQHTRRTKRKKGRKGRKWRPGERERGRGRSQLPTSPVQLPGVSSHVEVLLSFLNELPLRS